MKDFFDILREYSKRINDTNTKEVKKNPRSRKFQWNEICRIRVGDPIFASITRISICASNHVQISTFHSYIRDTPSNNSVPSGKVKAQ